MLKLGWLEGEDVGCAEILGEPEGDVEGTVAGSNEGP